VPIVCLFCDEPIAWGDSLARHPINTEDGLRIAHEECALRAVIGGINHLRGLCTCCGGTLEPDPPNVTKREAARLALAEWKRRHP
jgi:hypothetical protein